MPSYSKLKVAELRRLCDASNIDHEGLTKPQLIDALRHFDSAQSVSGDEGSDGVSSDEEVEQNDDDGSDEGDEGSDNGQVATLRTLSSQGGGLSPTAVDTGGREYQLEMARLRDREAERQLQAEREKRAEAREAREAKREAREAAREAVREAREARERE